jgi:hypothetical protein
MDAVKHKQPAFKHFKISCHRACLCDELMRQSLMRAVCVVVLQFGLIITDIQLLSVPHAGPLTRTHNCVLQFYYCFTVTNY